MIPKIFHRVWLGQASVPLEYERYWERWQLLHPDWEFREWRDDSIKELSLHSAIEKTEINAVKADIARYEILYKYGGIYLDCDMDCYQPIDSLICEDDNFIVCNQINDFKCLCSIGFFASSPRHPILEGAIKELAETDLSLINNSSPAEVTGPYFFRRAINNRKVKNLDPSAFYPYFHLKSEWYKRDMSAIYGVHSWGGSWLPIEDFLLLAKKQYKNGDFSSCLQTCQKGEDVCSSNDLKKAKKYLSIIRKLRFLCKIRQRFQRWLYIPFSWLTLFLHTLYVFCLLKSGKNIADKAGRKLYKVSLNVINYLLRFAPLEAASFQYNHILDYIFSNREPSHIIRVLEIGAMDGKSFDPLFPYLKTASNLEVVFVEPLPEMIAALKDNYKGYKERGNKFIFKEAAIVDTSETVLIHTIPKEILDLENLPEWTKGISTLFPEKNSLSTNRVISPEDDRSLSQFSVTREVMGLPLSAALEESNIESFDILQIDTEGCDLGILEQALEVYLPKVVCFEWINLELHEQKKAIKKLRAKNYFIFLSLNGCDCIACTRDIKSEIAFNAFYNHSVVFFPPNV